MVVGPLQGVFSSFGGLWIHLCDYRGSHLCAQLLCGPGQSRVPHSLQPRYGKGLPGWPSMVGNYLSPFNELLLKVLCLFSRKSKLNLDHANAACMGHAPPTFNHMTIFFSAHRC